MGEVCGRQLATSPLDNRIMCFASALSSTRSLGALRPLDFFLRALQPLTTQTIVAVTTEIKMVRGVCFLQSYLIITVTGLTDTENLNVHHLHNHQSTITPTRSGLLSTSSAISFIKLLQSNFDLCTFACLIFAMPHKKRK